jgi:DNA-binding NarL/FixJ family response regulator
MPTVLLVDDEPEVLDGLALVLRHQPMRLLRACSAEQALELIVAHTVNVIVCDERMPGTSGAVLLSRIADQYPQIVRIMLTGHASLDITIKAINDARVFRFLQKPCSSSKLIQVIREAQEESVRLASNARLQGLAEKRIKPENNHNLISTAVGQTKRRSQKPPLDNKNLISRREMEVLHLLVAARDISQIANQLFISEHTVRNHLKSMFQKLGVHSQRELIQKSLGH